MNEAQAEKVAATAKRLGCWPDDYERIDDPLVDPSWVVIEFGRKKGKPKTIVIDEIGETWS